MQVASMVVGTGIMERYEPVTMFPTHHYHPYSQANHYSRMTDPAGHRIVSRSSPRLSSIAARSRTPYGRHSEPRSPLSPSSDTTTKPSLPSISSLLHIAGSERIRFESDGRQHQSFSKDQASSARALSPAAGHHRFRLSESHGMPHHSQAHAGETSPLTILPPTPPMRPNSVVDDIQSPSAVSTRSSFSTTHSFRPDRAMNPGDAHSRRPSAASSTKTGSSNYSTHLSTREMLSGGQEANAYHSKSDFRPHFELNRNVTSAPTSHLSNAQGYASDRSHVRQSMPTSLQSTGPISQELAPTRSITPSSTASHPAMHALYQEVSPAHQHHHYISASATSTFPQNQDRYICPTCGKSFSRPSSLRIHVHSHTGEKPFKCPHVGCGKAFSVRSNMKRHERGCHAGIGLGSGP